MRLREIQQIIEENLPSLHNIDLSKMPNSNNFKLANYKAIRTSIIKLIDLGFFEDEKDKIIDHDLLINIGSNEVLLASDRKNALEDVVIRIVYKSVAIDELITTNLHSNNENENSLVISMPTRKLSIKEFYEITEKLYDIFRLITVLKDFNSEVTVENFDIGSKWLIFTLISNKAVTLFGNFVSIIQRTMVGNRQIKVLDKQLESLDIDEDTKQTVREAQIQYNQAMYRKLTEQFLESNDLDTQDEILNQLSKVAENIDNLLIRGVSFEAAISASTEVAASFPSRSDQKKLDQTAQLEVLKKLPSSDFDENI